MVKKTLKVPFLYVYRNASNGKIGGATNLTRLSEETGLSYYILKRVFLKEMNDIHLDKHHEIWRVPVENITMGRKRGIEFSRYSMGFTSDLR